MEKKELPRYPVIDIVATGRNIRRLRLEKGYSVNALQEYLGPSCPQGVYQWQAGRSLPSVDNPILCVVMVLKCCHAFIILPLLLLSC